MAATKTLSIKLSLQDAETVRQALEKLGADGQRALERISQAGKAPSAGLKALSDAAGAVKDALGDLGDRKSTRLNSSHT